MGVKKVWHSLLGKNLVVARCTVGRLMKRLGFEGIRRGKRIKTTLAANEPLFTGDKVKRQFKASRPNEVWVADFTYVSTWQGFAYVAFVIDLFARRIVGWKVSSHMRAQFVLDALEQALYQRRAHEELIHHSDKGSQYTSISYTQQLVDTGIEPSVGNTGCAYDNALAETIKADIGGDLNIISLQDSTNEHSSTESGISGGQITNTNTEEQRVLTGQTAEVNRPVFIGGRII